MPMFTGKPRTHADSVNAGVRQAILAWAGLHRHSYPWRRADASNWGKLIAELMLQRTTSARVVPVWIDFTTRLLTPADAASRPDEVLQLMQPLGLHKRAVSLIETAKEVATLGAIPHERERLLELPGVGVYTADAYLCFANGECRALVDSHISRLVHRLAGHAPTRQSHRTSATRRAVEELVGDEPTSELLYALLDFTIDICRPAPLCQVCPVYEARMCEYGLLVRASVHDERG